MTHRNRRLGLVAAMLVALVIAAAGGAAQSRGPRLAAGSGTGTGHIPVHVIENRGLYPQSVDYFVKGADKTLFFSSGGVTVALESVAGRWVVKLDFVDSDPGVHPCAEAPRAAIFSWFKREAGPDATGLRSFARLVYRDLWPGIDLVYRGEARRLKYKFRVRPGADPRRIRLRYRGAASVARGADGSIRVVTPCGAFCDAAPVAWQTRAGRQVPVAAEWVVTTDAGTGAAAELTFRLGDHDPQLPIVIDPVLPTSCGYVAGNDYEDNYGITLDAAGNAYITGETESATPSYPAKAGPDLSYNGNSDAYVAKISRSGQLIYCGYVGGADYEYGEGIAVDTSGNAYVVGYTESDEVTEGFPVKMGPDLTFNGPSSGGGDGFVAKVNAAGTALVYCGYIGGAQDDYPYGIAVDGSGSAYVTGSTRSNEGADKFPVRVGPDLTFNDTSNQYDAFVAKIHPSGTGMVYCGYIGGTQNDGSWGEIAVDAVGNAYVSGETASNPTTEKFPVLVGPDLTYNGGSDLFVAKVLASGTGLAYCGYIGGSQVEWAGGAALDSAGNLYVTGCTRSNHGAHGFPVKVGPDLTFNDLGTGTDAFVAKVDALGVSLVYCGYIGGSLADSSWSVAVDASGRAYVSGGTDSGPSTFPVLDGPELVNDGNTDAFIARVNVAGSGLDYCGYFGGTDYDESWSVAVDAAGNCWIAGDTESDETAEKFPVRVGPDLTYNGDTDVFVARLAFVRILASGSPRPKGTVTLHLEATDDGGRAYQVGSSFGAGPIHLGNRRLGLAPDPLLSISVNGLLPQVFSRYTGTLSPLGQGQAAIHIPAGSSLVGLRIHSAFVTLDKTAAFGMQSISNTEVFTIMP